MFETNNKRDFKSVKLKRKKGRREEEKIINQIRDRVTLRALINGK
jgi:hypothetical protein